MQSPWGIRSGRRSVCRARRPTGQPGGMDGPELRFEALPSRRFSDCGREDGTGGGTRTHTGHRSQRIFFSLRLSPRVSWTFSSPQRVSPVKSLHLPVWAWLKVASKGSPDFEGSHFIGFPTNAQVLPKSVASTNSATPAGGRGVFNQRLYAQRPQPPIDSAPRHHRADP